MRRAREETKPESSPLLAGHTKRKASNTAREQDTLKRPYITERLPDSLGASPSLPRDTRPL